MKDGGGNRGAAEERVVGNAWLTAVARVLRRRVRGNAPYLLLLAATARAEIGVTAPTEVGSGVTIKLASPVASVPRFGFMPVRVTVENGTPTDGTWRFRFDAGNARQFPGLGSSTFELEVPATRNREAWFFVPMAEPGVSVNPVAMTSTGSTPTTLPSTPPPIAGIYPNPGTPGVSYQVNSAVSSSPTGLTRTFTITQIGPANALPPVPQVLPNGATVSSTTRASDGLVTRTTVVPVTVSRGGGAISVVPGGGMTFAPASTSGANSGTAMMNARAALTKAGLNPSGAQLSTSTRVDSTKAGAQVFTVTLRQSGPASVLPAVDPKTLPPGFTAVTVTPQGDGSTVTREFTYVEQMATSRGTTWSATPFNAPSAAGPRPKTPSDLQAEARRVLGPTRLLEAQTGVKTAVSSQFISLQSAGSPTPANLIGNSLVVFEQTGPASLLSQVPGTLPNGVRVTRLPGATSGTFTRIVSYIDPDVLSGIIAHGNSLAANPSHAVAAATNLGRVELTRRGFLRSQPGVAITPLPTARSSVAGAAGPPDLIIFTENGTAALLPQPPADAVPAGITCTVTPGAIPGEVARNFVINIPAFLAGQTASASGPTATTTPGTRRPMRVATGPLLNPPMLFVEVSGPNVSRLTSRVVFPNNIGNTAMPPLATTAALDSALRGKLSAAGIRVPPNVAALDPAQLPADWRVWASFNTVLLKADEHALLDPARRAALRSWVATGGLLLLAPETAGEAQSERVGAGRIETLAEPIADIGPTDVVDKLQLTQLAPGMPQREQMMFQTGTRFGETVTFDTPDMLWVSLLLVAFALLVGPGNVFFFAPAKKRHRLFLTTPILSLGGAAAIGVAILLQDGLGGDGRRRALVVFVPGESQAAVFQEQGARSGFLSKREFALGEGVICAALPVDGNVFTMSAGETTLARQGDAAGGDWFRNRSRQAHLLRTLAPTRARIELVGRAADGAPQVESTVATELRDFRLRDEEGKIWSAEKVATGRRTTLRAVGKSETGASEGNDGTPQLLALVREAATLTEPWQWVAKGGGIDIAPIATLRSIRWEDEPVTYAGVAERMALASGKEKRGE